MRPPSSPSWPSQSQREYSIKISLDAGGKINIKWNSFFQSWFLQETSERKLVEVYREFNKVYGHGRNQTITPINIYMGEDQPFDGYWPQVHRGLPYKTWRLFHLYSAEPVYSKNIQVKKSGSSILLLKPIMATFIVDFNYGL